MDDDDCFAFSNEISVADDDDFFAGLAFLCSSFSGVLVAVFVGFPFSPLSYQGPPLFLFVRVVPSFRFGAFVC